MFKLKMMKNFGVNSGLPYFFNLGSALGLIILFQTMSGLLLVFNYLAGPKAFESIQMLMIEIEKGWLLRHLHANGASFFFILVYLHFFKALFYGGYYLSEVWMMGVMMMILLMGEAFLGYTLVWSQMSFWAGTVITGLLSVIPIFGKTLVLWIWGGFGLNTSTLKFFFMLHFLLPFVIIGMATLHLFFLHFFGSSSELGVPNKEMHRSFYPYYWIKDSLNIILFFGFFGGVVFAPLILGDPLGFEEVDSLSSPEHIIPEWYFLWAYGILRAVPSKMMGVLVMLGSIISLFMLPLNSKKKPQNSKSQKISALGIIFIFFFLSWLGSVEPLHPFVPLSQIITSLFFFLEIIYVSV